MNDITNGDIYRIITGLEDACRYLDAARSFDGEERADMLGKAFALVSSVTDDDEDSEE